MKSLLVCTALSLVLVTPSPASNEATPGGGILLSLRLPLIAEEVRSLGVPAADVRMVLQAGRILGLTSAEMYELLHEESRALRERGPIDHFALFLAGKLQQGLRGEELADALHAEHAKRGQGPGNKENGRRGDAKGAGS